MIFGQWAADRIESAYERADQRRQICPPAREIKPTNKQTLFTLSLARLTLHPFHLFRAGVVVVCLTQSPLFLALSFPFSHPPSFFPPQAIFFLFLFLSYLSHSSCVSGSHPLSPVFHHKFSFERCCCALLVHRILGVRYGLPPFQGGAAPVGCGRQRRRRFRTALQIIHLGRRTFLLLQLACVARTGRRLASPPIVAPSSHRRSARRCVL
jgi:hypothetical protein